MSLNGHTIALVEDDPIMGESLADRLSLEGAKVVWWQSCRAAAENLGRAAPDLVVCDIRLPDGSGEDVFQAASAFPDSAPFLFVTAYGEIDQAVRLMQQGAGDYVTKPFEMASFLTRVSQLVRPIHHPGEPLLGVSLQMLAIQKMLRRICLLPAPVLLVGETGVGKEVCARYLHGLRGPKPGPFVAVNCAAIPKDLMETELFGHERGAFTGASARHLGYAERARDGVLFLDEINELDSKLQAKLLRLIEDRSFHRLGGETEIRFGARLVCATNADLGAKVEEGSFRDDLFYRINVLTVTIPPLRDRRDDLEWLAKRFTDTLADGAGTDLARLSRSALDEIRAHHWPGNVRELRNRIERAVALAEGPWIGVSDLFPERANFPGEHNADVTLAAAREDAERRLIARVLIETGGDVEEAAARLDVARSTLFEKIRRLGIRT